MEKLSEKTMVKGREKLEKMKKFDSDNVNFLRIEYSQKRIWNR